MSEKAQFQGVLKTSQGERILIRRVSGAGISALQGFNLSLSDQTRARFFPHSYDEKILSKYVDRAQKGIDRSYVALSEQEIIGYFFLWEFQERIPVLGIGIADAYQGQGLGKQMMTILIEDAKGVGCAGIELTTVLDNERAKKLYQSMGFRHIRDTDNIAGDGRRLREHVMFLALIPGSQSDRRQFGPPV